MAVYEQTYKRYAGKLTPEWSRFLIIPRHACAVSSIPSCSRVFVICFLPLLVEAILIYLHHNVTALAIMNSTSGNWCRSMVRSFKRLSTFRVALLFFWRCWLDRHFSRDLRNNALPLYLCRPFSRTEYVMGKMSVILILLSAITWIPQLLLFFLQSYLEGFAWFRANLWIASAIVIGSVVWILLLALLSQTISALVKWRVVASAAMLGLFLIPSVFGEFINLVFLTRWGNIVSLGGLMNNVTAGLFGTFDRVSGRMQITDWDTDVVREIL